MLSSQELLTPALQSEFALFGTLDVISELDASKPYDEYQVEIKQVDLLDIPSTPSEYRYIVLTGINVLSDLKLYDDRLTREFGRKGRTLDSVVQPFYRKQVRDQLEAQLQGGIVNVNNITRRPDNYAPWRKRGLVNRIAKDSHTPWETKREVEHLRLNQAWVVPTVSVRKCQFNKPTVDNFTTGRYRTWVHSIAQHMRENVTTLKKTVKVVGNDPARFLYYQNNLSILPKQALKAKLLDAKLYFYDFKDQMKARKPTNWMISDFIPEKPKQRILYFGTKVMTSENVLMFEHYFRRHRPRFIAACKYLRNESDPIYAVLQQEVNAVYESTQPKLLQLNGEKFDLDRIKRNEKFLPKEIFNLCIRHFAGDIKVNFGILQSKFSRLSLLHLQMMGDDEPIVTDLGPASYGDVKEQIMESAKAELHLEGDEQAPLDYVARQQIIWAGCLGCDDDEVDNFLAPCRDENIPPAERYEHLKVVRDRVRKTHREASIQPPDMSCIFVEETLDNWLQELYVEKMNAIKPASRTYAEVAKEAPVVNPIIEEVLEEKEDEPVDFESYGTLKETLLSNASGKPSLLTRDDLPMITDRVDTDTLSPGILAKNIIYTTVDILMQVKEYFELNGFAEAAKLIALLYSLYQQTTWQGCVGCISLYVLSVNATHMTAAISRLKSMVSPVIQFQADDGSTTSSDKTPNGTSFWSLFTIVTDWGKELWSCIAELIWTTLGPTFMPESVWNSFKGKDYISELLYHTKLTLMKMTAKTIADAVVETFFKFYTMITKCIRLRSFKPLYMEVFDPIDWKFKCNAVTVYYSEIQMTANTTFNKARWDELKENSLIPKDWREPFTPLGLVDYVNALVKEGEIFADTFRKDLPLLADVKLMIRSLKALQESSSISYGVMGKRIQPFGVYLAGVAGSGKTNLADSIFKSIGRANNYSIEPTMKYAWQKGVNFQDSLGYTQWAISMDDIDVSPAPPQQGTESHVESVLRVINNDPLVVEQSRVEAKGKVAARPLLVTYTSNFGKGRLLNYALEPTQMAFYRRFPVWILVKAKKEFGVNGTLEKDLVKTSVDGEIYDFCVFTFDPAVKDFPYTQNKNITTKAELLKFLNTEYRKHIDHQLELLKNNYTSDYCPFCFADWSPITKCSCQRVLQSRWAMLAVPSLAYFVYRWSSVLFKHERENVNKVLTDVQEVCTSSIGTLAAIKQFAVSGTLTLNSFRDRVDNFFSIKWIIAPAIGLLMIFLNYKLHEYMFKKDKEAPWVLQSVEHNAVSGSVPTAWTRAPQEFSPGMPTNYSTFTKDDAIKHLQESYVTVTTARGSVHGVVVCNNGVVTVLHVLHDLQTFNGIPLTGDELFTISQKGIDHKIAYNSFNVTRIAADLVFIKVPGLTGYTGVGKKIWTEIDNSVSEFDEVLLVRKDSVETCSGALTWWSDSRIVATTAKTINGDCGYCYLARMNKHWKIVSVHQALNASIVHGKSGVSMIVTQNGLTAAAEKLATKFQMLAIPLKQTGRHYDKQSFSYYPERSEPWTAVSHHGVQISPIGTAEIKIHGSTMKSEIRPTLYASDFENYEIEHCGRLDYWQIPSFKGKMVDGKWVSPYLNALLPLKRVSHKMDYLWLALADYLCDIETLQNDGYSEISYEEAIVGVPGSVIQAADLNTSVGMPFNQPKRTKIVVRDRQAFVDPELTEVLAEIEKSYAEGDIPCAVALSMLKDEAISYKKNEAIKPRIFNVLPFAVNWKMKKKLAPLEAFFRNNKAFFGSMVGINMTSLEINVVVDILKRTDEELSRILALDISNEDKALDGTFADIISLVFWAITTLLGADGDYAWACVHALKNAVHVVKNDLFQIGAQNLSGQDKTVTWNCIATSICLIYFYYRMKYPNGLPEQLGLDLKSYQTSFFQLKGIVPAVIRPHLTYRKHCSKVTYGDDSLQSISPACKFYEPNEIPRLGRELGFEFTDEAKTADIRWKKITECTFLKRQFVWRTDIQSYVGLLSKKTLAKMLRLRKKSTLTDRDHAAEQLTNVMREYAYDTREAFSTMLELVIRVAEKYELKNNQYYRVSSYDEYVQQMKDGSFSTWSPIVLKPEDEGDKTFKPKCPTNQELI